MGSAVEDIRVYVGMFLHDIQNLLAYPRPAACLISELLLLGKQPAQSLAARLAPECSIFAAMTTAARNQAPQPFNGQAVFNELPTVDDRKYRR